VRERNATASYGFENSGSGAVSSTAIENKPKRATRIQEKKSKGFSLNQEPKNLIKTQEGKRMPPKTSRKCLKIVDDQNPPAPRP
jgi:hypothetical protein